MRIWMVGRHPEPAERRASSSWYTAVVIATARLGDRGAIRHRQTGRVPSAVRAIDRGTRLAGRQLRELGDEFRERRLQLNRSQAVVAAACDISRVHYGHIENGRVPGLSVLEVNRIAAVLGLVPSVRLYPDGPPVRDVGHTNRLERFLLEAARPISFRLEVPLPGVEGRLERRAWDAVLFLGAARTSIELEMRLRDVQALIRRIDLKRRDDPTESFLLLVADTRTNRRVLALYGGLFVGLPRLKSSSARGALQSGRLPPTGILLV